MCGISGYLGNQEIPQERIDKCLSLMHRRGPDHQAYKHFTNPAGKQVYLLSSRLAIIDLDPRANQPMAFVKTPLLCGVLWLAWNGELYNYKEFRAELEKEDYYFYTTSDTEVLLRQLYDKGLEGLTECEGMWAFALYDERSGSLSLGRDRFGEKPLYLHWDKGDLYFGSEPKFIFALCGRSLPINYLHLYRFLVNGYKSLYKGGLFRETFFEGLTELPPAHTLKITPDGTGIDGGLRSYWSSQFRPDEKMSYEDAVEGVRERLIRSVELRLRADVPVAFALSGGIDSNALIGIAIKKLGVQVHSFHIADQDSRYNEFEVVQGVVGSLQVPVHVNIPLCTEGFLEGLRELVHYHDAPVLTLTAYVQWLLVGFVAQQGYKVLVSGTGADEIWAGYYEHWLFYLRELFKPDIASGVLYAETLADWEEHIKPLVRNPRLRDLNRLICDPDFRPTSHTGEFAQYLKVPFNEPFIEKRFCQDLLRSRMQNEMQFETVPVILNQEDLDCMFWSVENRSPFLDRVLYEFSLTIPTRHLIRNGYTKAPLRDAVRGMVPDEVLNLYRKVGYNTNILSLLNVQDPGVQGWLLDNSPFYDYVYKEKVEKLATKAYLENSESKLLFSLISVKAFLEEFL